MARDELVPTSERRTFVLQRRRAGKTTHTVAEEAKEHFGEERLPNGWDWSYVAKDTMRALRKARDEMSEIAKEYQTVEINRLEALLRNLWPYAQEHEVEVVTEDGETKSITRPPDEKKIDRILAIMDRLERLYGVDEAPDLPADATRGQQNVFVQVNQQLINEGS